MNKEIFRQFNEVSSELLKLLSMLSEEELNKLPFENSWTAGQLGDHLLQSYAVADTLRGNTQAIKRPADQKVAAVETLFLDFNIKMKSPAAVLPSADPIVKEKLLNALHIRIEQLKEIIQHEDLSPSCTDFVIPQYGAFTRLEWIFFTIFHTRRHVHQLKEIIKSLKKNKTSFTQKIK